MIETKQAIENLDGILSVPGVDAAYIGPSDLAFALGLPPRMDHEDPLHIATVARILETCRKNGVAAGSHTGGPAFSRRLVDQGFQMVTLTSDIGSMGRGVREQVKELGDWRGTLSASAG
jgi:4-hydroxy-2-oxoheptanedioate aldolase